MWGTLINDPPIFSTFRFIPTHVGNTRLIPFEFCFCSVHPHACGEHYSSAVGPSKSSGSSPRMWGTPDREYEKRNLERFIPTHVGNTLLNTPPVGTLTVHPHACGEHSMIVTLVTGPIGSSPRMWGTPVTAPAVYGIRRFIPTHVGNTFLKKRKRPCRSVHPHACGEHKQLITNGFWIIGSSPRMWGTLYYR